jgi:hypothetical protein
MYREITTGIRDVLDPEWDEVSRIIDFSNCWDNDIPTGDNEYPIKIKIGYNPYKKWSPLVPRTSKVQKPEPQPRRKRVPIGDRQKMLWWRHEMQEISEEALARLYNLDPAALHEAIQDEWAVIYGFWSGTPEEFRAEMRRPENVDKHRA